MLIENKLLSMQRRNRYLLIVLLTGGVIVGSWLMNGPNDDVVDHPDPEIVAPLTVVDLPPVVASRFANASSSAKFTGAESCAACHPAQFASYLQTPHSRALGDVDLQTETSNAAFKHPRSGRRYEVIRKADQVWHRETLLADDGKHLVLAEYPVRYTIGSGHHSRSYLIESDGFLLESPITWYSSKKLWAMSPGYDAAQSPGFERVADFGCVVCHAGRVEPVDGNRYRVKIHDHSISCESCHGPGSLHAAKHQGGVSAPDVLDLTIVNPVHLTREESEATCGQCHLRGDAGVFLQGRSQQDFRPGLRLSDFRADYALEQQDNSMKVVGHVEQMRLSRCYQETETLTCTTCHDPHVKPSAELRIEHFRQKCLTCHAVDACGLELDQRKARDQRDNCVACHMPQSATDIPHFAFTHHRIGKHEPDKAEAKLKPPSIGRLVALYDLSHLPKIEQMRCLGLSYLELSDKQDSREAREAYRQRAIELLEQVSQAGLQDTDVEASLARFYWETGELQRTIRFASAALQSKGTSGARANAKFLLGDSYLQLNQPDKAQPFLEQLVKQRRQSEDWILLGLCHRAASRFDQAIASIEQAVEISPMRIDAREMLIKLYEARKDVSSATKHRRAATLLERENRARQSRPGSQETHEKVPLEQGPSEAPGR